MVNNLILKAIRFQVLQFVPSAKNIILFYFEMAIT
jgi:hypothetical protein